MSAPAASSASSPRVFTWTPDGWTKLPLTSLDDGLWGIALRAEGPRLVRVNQGRAQTVSASPQGKDVTEAIVFVLGALMHAPIVTSVVPASRAGRPSRSSRRLLIFSPERWQWESAERTGAKTGDIFRVIERSGTPVDVGGQPGPAMFRWDGETGAEVSYDVDALGPALAQAALIRQAFAWLCVSVGPDEDLPAPPPAEAAPVPERRRRRVLATPPPPARRALAAVPLDDDQEDTLAAPVPIPDLPPEPPAIDDDPTQEFPNMPSSRAQQPAPPPNTHPNDEAAPAEVALREPTPEVKAQVRALYDSGQINAACDIWMSACGYPEGTARQAQADMMKALGRGQSPPPARRGTGTLHLLKAEPVIAAPPIDDVEREYLARVPAEFAEPDDYDAAQEEAARAEVTAPPEPELDDDPESAEQIRTIPVSFPTTTPGETRASFTRNDGTEPGLDGGMADAYEVPPTYVEQDRTVGLGDVLPQYGRCVSVVNRNEIVVLTDEEREACVVELTEMPVMFGALEERRRKLMAELKEAKIALKKRELLLGDAIRTFKMVRPMRVAGMLRDGWITEIDADNPTNKLATRKPNDTDQLQADLFDKHREDEDEDENDADSYEGEEE